MSISTASLVFTHPMNYLKQYTKNRISQILSWTYTPKPITILAEFNIISLVELNTSFSIQTPYLSPESYTKVDKLYTLFL